MHSWPCTTSNNATMTTKMQADANNEKPSSTKDAKSKPVTGDDEERIRERLKQKQEARRASSAAAAANPETNKSDNKRKSDSKKDKDETSPSHKKRRRHRGHNGNRHGDRHHRPHHGGGHHGHRRGGPPPPPEWRGRGPPPHMMPRHGGNDRHWRGRGGPPPPPPEWRGRGPPPPHYRRDVGPHYREGGGGRRSRSMSRSMSHSRSYSRSRSRSYSSSSSRSRSVSSSRSRSESSRSRSYSRSRSRSRDRRHRRHRRSPSYSDMSTDASSASYSSSSSESDSEDKNNTKNAADDLTKDQRTVLVSQLVMRTTERDVKKFFRKTLKLKVKEVILLRDRRTNRHKGIAYVELAELQDVQKAIAASGVAPDFQRFPILIKASEAEKNYSGTAAATVAPAGPMVDAAGKLYEAQRVYVGNLDPSVGAEQLQTVFVNFGALHKVALQTEPSTGVSRGFVFLSFSDPKAANLAIQAMAGQVWAGRAIKTGWANHTSSMPGVEMRTSDEFPDDAAARIQKAQMSLAQVQALGAATPAAGVPSAAVSSVAEAAINAALGLPMPSNLAAVAPAAAAPAAVAPAVVASVPVAAPTIPSVSAPSIPVAAPTSSTTAAVAGSEDAKTVLGTPSMHLLVRNMFNKDEETEAGWEEEIRLDFEEECQKYGKMDYVQVMSSEPGGKIYASFTTLDGAKNCAVSLAGRWFDKRQLRVEYVSEQDLPKNSKIKKEEDACTPEAKMVQDVKKENGDALPVIEVVKRQDNGSLDKAVKAENDGPSGSVVKEGGDESPATAVRKVDDVRKEE